MKVIIFAAFIAFLVDQFSKYTVVYLFELNRVREIAVFNPFLNFRYGENRGINFGIFGNAPDAIRWVLVAFALLIIIAVLYWVYQYRHHLVMTISAGVLIGGAVGNLLDRVIHGFVIDFLNMSCCGINNPYVFNIADIFVVFGAIGLIYFESRVRHIKST
ncbi:MAG: signal peptidase II [Aestuariivita sp.]|nr:signal peptidase II [Aestuariivita sp.]